MVTMMLPFDGEQKLFSPSEGADIIRECCKNAHYYIKGKKKPRKYYECIATFDIETTKLENENWKPPMAEGYRYFNYCYCWQFMIDDIWIMGRRAEEFFGMLDAAADELDGKLIVWIHNAAFEVNNLADFFYGTRFEDGFWKSSSSPLYVRFENYEFRCSAQLTHKSLAELGKDVGIPKLKEVFDYSRILSPESPLSLNDLNYCYRDVKIPYEYLKAERNNYCAEIGKDPNPCFIPLTQTGFVRTDIQMHFSSLPVGHYTLENTELTQEQYHDIRPAFWGGYVHGNFRVIGEPIRDPFLHVDICSAYPWYICTQKMMFHIYESTVYDVDIYLRNLQREDYGQIACIDLSEVWLRKGHIPYIPYAKGNTRILASGEVVEENGKIIYAEHLRLTVCDIDMRLILNNYRFDIKSMRINKLYVGDKKPLPYAFVSRVLRFYEDKTKLKGLHSEDGSIERQYQRGKQKLNSAYGMAAQALETELYELVDGLVQVTGSEYKPAKTVPYQWALQITAGVRAVVYGFITWLCKTKGQQAYYSDTDSVFCKDTPEARRYIERYNKHIIEELTELQKKYFNIMPKNKHGETQYLGTLGLEEDCLDAVEFMTIGAKRYYITHKDGTTDITFSGLRATKTWYDEDGTRKNGRNTERLIQKYGSVTKAFRRICDGTVELEYEEGTDKLSNYNVRGDFVSHAFGYEVRRPCTYTLYGMGTKLSLNDSLYNFLTLELSEELE